MFGSPRTGSTWLSRMMGELEGHTVWFEPFVGEIFGRPTTTRIWNWQCERENYILSTSYKKVWLKTIRNFVLAGANARFPKVVEQGYLIVKEPNGSVGAPLLMEAFPESRMIFLIRDPRDIVASSLDAMKKGSWTSTIIEYKSDEGTLADRDPDAFVKEQADRCLMDLGRVKQAYDAHEGRKVLVRYEDLRHDALGELKRIYSSLDIPVEEKQLHLAVEKHAWENMADSRKGPGKAARKAKPGGWREDLTQEQVGIVEKTTAPILEEFYGDRGKSGQTLSTAGR